MISRSI